MNFIDAVWAYFYLDKYKKYMKVEEFDLCSYLKAGKKLRRGDYLLNETKKIRYYIVNCDDIKKVELMDLKQNKENEFLNLEKLCEGWEYQKIPDIVKGINLRFDIGIPLIPGNERPGIFEEFRKHASNIVGENKKNQNLLVFEYIDHLDRFDIKKNETTLNLQNIYNVFDRDREYLV